MLINYWNSQLSWIDYSLGQIEIEIVLSYKGVSRLLANSGCTPQLLCRIIYLCNFPNANCCIPIVAVRSSGK